MRMKLVQGSEGSKWLNLMLDEDQVQVECLYVVGAARQMTHYQDDGLLFE